MSSNCFLLEIKLLSLPAYNGRSLRRSKLSVDANGQWSVWGEAAFQPVLLLPHRSFWTRSFAALSLQYADSKVVVLCFWRKDQLPDVWRRARVRFTHGI
jgi:hypothetical protein